MRAASTILTKSSYQLQVWVFLRLVTTLTTSNSSHAVLGILSLSPSAMSRLEVQDQVGDKNHSEIWQLQVLEPQTQKGNIQLRSSTDQVTKWQSCHLNSKNSLDQTGYVKFLCNQESIIE